MSSIDFKYFALGFGIATLSEKKEVLEVYYNKPILNLNENINIAIKEVFGSAGIFDLDKDKCNKLLGKIDCKEQKNVLQKFLDFIDELDDYKKLIVCILENDTEITKVEEAYLKLQLLSHRKLKPHQLNLQNIFASLPNVAWTNIGAVSLEDLSNYQLESKLSGEELIIYSVDKFPPMANYVVPNGVRIADASRIRLGAYLGEGTTIMHEGFVNFNAGCEGPNMIEGRISAGVWVHKGADLGGGCSTMGTLSGGGNVVLSVGEDSLIGANAGTGIVLGKKCIIESGLYVTAGTKVNLLDENNNLVSQLKARDLSGKDNLLFRRNSITGAVECKTTKKANELNEMLHKN